MIKAINAGIINNITSLKSALNMTILNKSLFQSKDSMDKMLIDMVKSTGKGQKV